MADWESLPTAHFSGEATIPGDKSISHRMIILNSIRDFTSTIHGFLKSEDCLATIAAFRAMGVNIDFIEKNTVRIHGVGKYGLVKPNSFIDCGNSGTTMRLLMGLLSAQDFDTVLVGDSSLSKRPMERVALPLRKMGANIVTTKGCAPVEIFGDSALTGITYKMPQASAQVKSAIMLAGLYAKGKTKILESSKTRDHTERLLSLFLQKQELNWTVPGDLSSAAFLIVAALLSPKGELYISKVGFNPTRIGFIKILQAMGAQIDILDYDDTGVEPVASLYIKSSKLHGIIIPPELVSLAIDEFPIIFIAAAMAKGTTILRNASELRLKESDRIISMVTGLRILGIKVEALEDGIIIEGSKQFLGGEVDSFQDHRIAMAFLVAGSVAKEAIKVKSCEVINTSFPTFFDLVNSLGMKVRI